MRRDEAGEVVQGKGKRDATQEVRQQRRRRGGSKSVGVVEVEVGAVRATC